MKNYPLGSNTVYANIPSSDFKTLHREVFNEQGCIWTRLTNDVIRKDDDGPFVYMTLLNDSINFITRPASCFRHDTVMQINPITLYEELVVQIDSVTKTKFDLGDISKSQLLNAILNQFNLDKNGMNLRISYLWLWIFNEKCGDIYIDYSNRDALDLVKKKIENISQGSNLIIGQIRFEDTNGRKFYGHFGDVASFKLVD